MRPFKIVKKRLYLMLPYPYTDKPEPVIGAIWRDTIGDVHQVEARIRDGAIIYEDLLDAPIRIIEEMAELAERRGYLFTKPISLN